MLLDRPAVAAAVASLGAELRPEGLCRGDLCTPLPAAARTDLNAFARCLRMPLVHDAEAGLWALGPPAQTPILSSALAPDLVLPDVDGRSLALSSLEGQKVLLLAWASW